MLIYSRYSAKYNFFIYSHNHYYYYWGLMTFNLIIKRL